MKIIGSIFLVIILIIGGTYASRNIIIEKAINSGGSLLLNTDVSVDSVNFSPFAGKFNIKGLSVANPKGFTAGNAIYLGEINIKLDPKSILTEKIMVEEIRIIKPEIHILGNPQATNIFTLQKSVSNKNSKETLSKKLFDKESTKEEEHKEKEEHCKNVEIRYFTLQEGKVSASFEGLGKTAETKLPAIEIHNIGKNKSMGIQQVVGIIFSEVMKISQKTALSGTGFGGQVENFKSELQEKTKGIKKDLKDRLKSFGF